MFSLPSKTSYNDNIDTIVTQLYQLPNKVQFCHHLTTSYSAHKALDRTYEAINDLKDDIVEKIIGYTGKRFSTLSLTKITGFKEQMCKEVSEEIMELGKYLEDWASNNGYCDIENLAQSYSGEGAKLAYLLTLV